MVDLKVNYLGLNQTLRMPTSMSEIDMNVIADYVKHVNVSKNYALIAVVFKERPISIVSLSKQNKNASVSGVAVMIKSNTDNEFINTIKLGETRVIAEKYKVNFSVEKGFGERFHESMSKAKAINKKVK